MQNSGSPCAISAVTRAQGYLFGRPVAADTFEAGLVDRSSGAQVVNDRSALAAGMSSASG